MKLLMLSTDRSVFDDVAPIRERFLEQAKLVDSLDIVVFTPRGEKFKKLELAKNLHIHPTSSASKWSYLPDAYKLGGKILAEKREEKWLVTAQDPFFVGAIGYLLSRKWKIPLHLQLHTDPWSLEWRKERFLNELQFIMAKFLLRKADGVRVVSERVKREVLKLGVPEEKITKVPIWVNVEKFMDKEAAFDLHRSYSAFTKIILSLGRLQPEKNYAKLIRAFAQVAKIHSDALLLIVGSGPERERLISLVKTLALEKSVILLPWARDTLSYYKSSNIYAQPSLYEGWGMAIIEAMASGLPVVMTDVGCAGEVVKNEESGLVVPVGDEEALSLALLRLLEDNQLSEKLSRNGREAVKKLATKAETLRLYKASWMHAAGEKEEAIEAEKIEKHGGKAKAKNPKTGKKRR